MKRRFFALLIVLMTTSLTGIVCLQGYLISDAHKGNEKHFNFNVNQALATTSNKIQDQEFLKHFYAVKKASHSLGENEHILKNICSQSSDFSPLESEELHLRIRKALDSVVTSIQKDTILGKNKVKHHTAHDLSSIADYEYSFYQSLINEYTNKLEIPHRVNSHQVSHLLNFELQKNDVDVAHEFAIVQNGILSSVKSKEFDYKGKGKNLYKVALFEDIDGISDIELLVNFTGKKAYVIESIGLMVLLSVILCFVIMATFFYAYRLLKSQRNLSDIKTDFINNMTHELKTPIATISLALDFIKNPKVINDASMRGTYLNMIDQENKRIHAQVENALRISKLESKELNMPKERESLHDLVHTAITGLEQQIDELNAELIIDLKASKNYILANAKYFKTVVVNIIDNSLKYSEKTPKINISSENVKNSIILKVEDNGVGIHKSAKKNIFEKFFREPTGDLHNVKGHGLGLAYVKQILDDHQGEINIESTKGKGTTVVIKLPLIS